MKDKDFMEQKASDMTIEELADAIKIKKRLSSERADNQELKNIKQSVKILKKQIDKGYGKILDMLEKAKNNLEVKQ